MQQLIDQRVTMLKTMVDVGTRKQIQGFKRYN